MGCFKLIYGEETGVLKVVHNALKINEKGGAGIYRYGFNGKEIDQENNGDYDYGFRIYDPRICRFLSVDPLSPKYPELTTYQFASNTPIVAVDLDGLEAAVLSVGARGTYLFVSVAANISLAVAHNGVSLYFTPEAGLGTGVSLAAGASIAYFPGASSSEQFKGWGYNIGASIAGTGLDYVGSIQQDETTGVPNDIKHGGNFSPPKVGSGAGAEGHFTATYSILIGTAKWEEIQSKIQEWADASGIEGDALLGYIDKAKQAYDNMVTQSNSTSANASSSSTTNSSTSTTNGSSTGGTSATNANANAKKSTTSSSSSSKSTSGGKSSTTSKSTPRFNTQNLLLR